MSGMGVERPRAAGLGDTGARNRPLARPGSNGNLRPRRPSAVPRSCRKPQLSRAERHSCCLRATRPTAICGGTLGDDRGGVQPCQLGQVGAWRRHHKKTEGRTGCGLGGSFGAHPNAPACVTSLHLCARSLPNLTKRRAVGRRPCDIGERDRVTCRLYKPQITRGGGAKRVAGWNLIHLSRPTAPRSSQLLRDQLLGAQSPWASVGANRKLSQTRGEGDPTRFTSTHSDRLPEYDQRGSSAERGGPGPLGLRLR
jgi:hypothetical protein